MAEKFTPLHYIVIVLVIGLVAAVAAVSWNTADPATISVSGSAEMLADPNEAHVYLGVTSQSVTASQAQQMASTTIGTVIVALKNAGVAEDDIETYYVRLTPRYDYSETGKREIVGYDATHMLKAKADVDSAGDAINAAVMAGGNKIEKIDYSVDKETEASLKKELLAEAAADARAKAEGLASALGVKIVRVKAASESVSFIPYRAMMEDAVMAGGPAPMPPGKV
ncbi:MAG: SIMPL domain-containing protein, partial [Candidatus Aenigmarchaeota archaeon]